MQLNKEVDCPLAVKRRGGKRCWSLVTQSSDKGFACTSKGADEVEENGEVLLYTRDGQDPESLWCIELHRSPGQDSGEVPAAVTAKPGRTGGYGRGCDMWWHGPFETVAGF
jgi:hypothetical protein